MSDAHRGRESPGGLEGGTYAVQAVVSGRILRQRLARARADAVEPGEEGWEEVMEGKGETKTHRGQLWGAAVAGGRTPSALSRAATHLSPSEAYVPSSPASAAGSCAGPPGNACPGASR